MKTRPLLLRLLVIALVVGIPFACRRAASDPSEEVEEPVPIVAIGRDETEQPELTEEPDPEPPKDSDVVTAGETRNYPDGKSWTDDFPDGKSWTPAEPVEPIGVAETPVEAPPEEPVEPPVVVAREPEPQPEPDPVPEQQPETEPPPDPQPEPLPEPVPEPEPPPEPEPEPEPAPPPEPAIVVVEAPEPVTVEAEIAEPMGPPGPVPVDTTGAAPVIRISSPLERAFYTTEMIVEGFISNSPGSGASDSIEEFSYIVTTAPDISGTIYHNERDGDFWFSFLSANLEGTHTLEIRAKNAGGNERVATIQLHDGNLKPIVQFERPIAKQGYGTRLLVRGRAYDPSDDLGQPRDVEVVEYEVYPAGTFSARERVSGSLEVETDGTFSGVITTRSFDADIDVIVRAQTTGGKIGENTITLPPADGDIPSFRAEAGDRQVSLVWTELPNTMQYDAFYAPDRPDSEWTQLFDVTSPMVIPALDNEQRYRFQLRSTLPGNETEISAIRRNIPLPDDGIVLEADDQYRRISLAWNPIEGAESYRVVRADLGTVEDRVVTLPPTGSDEWRTIAVVDDRDFNDIGVDLGATYAYRVGPNYPDSVLSAARVGRPAVMPAAPARTSSELETGRAVRRLASLGSYAAYTDASGLHLVDISIPALPTSVSSIPLDNTGGLAIAGDTAVVTSDRGANFVSLRDKTAPQLDSRWSLPDATDVVFVNAGTEQVLALSAKSRGITILDAAGTTAQTQLAVIDSPDASVLASDGRYLFVGHEGGIDGYDLSVPERPRSYASVISEPVTGLDFDLSSGLAASATAERIQLYRVEAAGDLEAAGSIPLGGGAVALYESSDRTYLVSVHDDGVRVTDVTNPYSPEEFAFQAAPSAEAIKPIEGFAGESIILVGRADGMQILDLFVVGRSHVTASTVTGGGATGVNLISFGDQPLAVVADGSAGVAAYPADPETLDWSEPLLRLDSEYAIRVFVDPTDQSRVFVADGRGGLRSFEVNVSGDRFRGTELLSFPTDGTLWDMEIVHRIVDGDGRTLAYLANGDGGFVVADVSERDIVRQIGSIVLRDARSVVSLESLDLRGGSRYVVLTDTGRGLLLVNVTDPLLPTVVEERSYPGARQVATIPGTSNLAVLTDDGITIVEFSAGFGAGLGSYDTRFAERFAISGDLMVVAEGFRGVSIVDISDPAQPTLIGSSDLEYAADVAISGNTLFAVDNESLHALDLLIPPWLRRE